MGLFNVQEICDRTKALGLGGKVTISHGFCLGGITERKAAEAAAMMAKAGVALVTHGAGGLTMPPIEMLRAAGVLVFAGNDDIRDTWSPYVPATCWNERQLSAGRATSDATPRWRSPSTWLAPPAHRRSGLAITASGSAPRPIYSPSPRAVFPKPSLLTRRARWSFSTAR